MLTGKESACRFDQRENGGLDWWGELCPNRDYLSQFGTGRDWISGVYSGVCMIFPFIYGQNSGVRIPPSPPYFTRELVTRKGTHKFQSREAPICPK